MISSLGLLVIDPLGFWLVAEVPLKNVEKY
jgi:hypothetical protein